MKFKIKHFGPIVEGFTDHEYMDIRGVSLFIGSQGTGKSSVAKALSTLIWIEKALIRKDFTVKQLQSPGRFKSHFSFHNIKNYFQDTTELEYIGEVYRIHYKGEKDLSVAEVQRDADVYIPKIMYVPSERNLLSAYPKPTALSGLVPSLTTFLEEYENAKHFLDSSVDLPISSDTSFSYDRLNDTSSIIRKENKTKLSEASSGYQSIVPLFLVSRHLSNQLRNRVSVSELLNRNDWMSYMKVNMKRAMNMQNELNMLFNRNLKSKKDEKAVQKLSEKLINRYIPSCFINIVEEPEQNLFPDSQIRIMFQLLSYMNFSEKNQLIITTHSPYLINALSLAVACRQASEKTDAESNIRKKLSEIVPQHAWLAPDNYTVYKLDELGNIFLLDSIDGLPSDDNDLNNYLGQFNDQFGDILELGEL